MKALLAIEWLKIRRYRTVWILTGIFLGFIVLINWLIDSEILALGGGKAGINILNSDYTFSSVWLNTTYWAKVFSGLIALLFVILTTNEYQYRTNRQNVIDGLTRTQFFHAKWFLVLTASVIVTLFTFLLGLVFGLANGSSISGVGNHIEKLLYLFILTLNYFGLAMTMSFFLKRTGLAILIFILYAYPLETILYLISMDPNNIDFGYYLPMESSAGLLSFPLPEIAKQMAPQPDKPSETVFLLCSFAYISLYYFLGRMKLLRGDW
jgi:ABC-2 type transport system permease protein